MPDEDGKQGGEQGKEGGETLTFEAWHEKQDDTVKGLVESHTRGLKSALEAERTQRKQYEKELRDTAKKLEKGSDERKAIEEQANRVQALERQSVFYDAAHAAGATNLRLAFLAAQDADLVRDDGSADFNGLRERFPQLFTTTTKPKAPDGKAGTGNNADKPTSKGMNAFIRVGAGHAP